MRAALDVDPDANMANKAGDSALHAAAQSGFDTVIQYLVDRGAQVNAKNARGQTPLAVASQRGGRGGRGAAPASTTIALLRKLRATE